MNSVRRNDFNLLLYAITDRACIKEKTLEYCVEEAILGGAACIQLREKDIDDDEYIRRAISIKNITDKYNVPLIINDNVNAAKECDAAGVHLGQGDMPADAARNILGDDKIIGVTAKSIHQASEAEKMGADYLGSGAVFGSSTKSDAKKISKDELLMISQSVKIPVIAIGGITAGNILELRGTGISGVAAVSSVFGAPDIREAAHEMLILCMEAISG